MVKGFRQIASLTLLSRILGLVREICFAHFFGAGAVMDIWFIAFKIPNLSRRLFGEGAASASFIPIYSQQLHEESQDAPKYAGTVVSIVVMILTLTMLIGWAAMGSYNHFFAENAETKLILTLSSLMLPYMVMICTVAILAGILNVHMHFAAPAFSPVILNIFIIAATILSSTLLKQSPRTQVFYIAGSVLLAGVIQLLIQFTALRYKKIHIKPSLQVHTDPFRKTMLLMGPMIIGLTATQINTLADDLIAWFFSASAEKGQYFTMLGKLIEYPMQRGSVAHLNYAQRMYQFPLGVIGISLATAIFPVLSKNAAQKNIPALCETVSKGIKTSIALAIPATAGLVLISNSVLKLLFQHGEFTANDTSITATVLSLYSLGLAGYFCQQILSRCFYSLQNSTLPVKTALIAIAVNLPLNLILIWYLKEAGLALSTAFCSYLQVIILIKALKKHIGQGMMFGVGKLMLKTTLASLAMFGIGAAVMKSMADFTGFGPNAAKVFITLAVCTIVYIGFAFSFNIIEIKALLSRGKSDINR